MKRKNGFLSGRFLAVITVLLLFCPLSTLFPQTTLPAEDIAEKALAATVYLEMKDSNGKILGFGSGFFIKSNLIATNYHVIEGAARGTAKLVGKHTTYNIEGTTATDKTNDLALLRVTAYGVKPLSLGNSDTVRIGETVYVAGNPKGLEGTFSDGIISSRRDKDTKEQLQMTAPISPGSSGGPVLNRNGDVIGVSVAVHRALDAQNLNFAVPTKYLEKLLEESKQAEHFPPTISAETYFQWGNAKYKLGDYKGAIADYTDAILLKPNYVYAYGYRGNGKYKLGQYSDAIADFDIVIRLKPDSAIAYNNRGIAKYDLGKHFAAISDYDIAIRLKPKYADVYINRGLAKERLGQHVAAISDYDIVIRLKPDDAEAYVKRGNAKYELEQHLAAISDYDTAIRLQPDDAEAYVKRGSVKTMLQRHFAAITDFDTVIRLKPNYAEAYALRGMVKSKLGHISEAKPDYQKALKLTEKVSDANLKTEIAASILRGLFSSGYQRNARYMVILNAFRENQKLTKEQLKALDNLVREIE
ncbi:MAG: tetratricopeptide repeat protein [Candidatus Poribacteria bacterium]|nr:tetratricopeptide repeat protein [Candidatus Poribacteria bacterium]